MSELLLLLLALPAAGAVLLAVAGPRAEAPARWIGLGVAAVNTVIAIALAAGFEQDQTALQAETNVSWIPALGVRFHIGIDGISLPLVLLTVLLGLLCAAYTLRWLPSPGNARAFTALLLLLQSALLGTFVAADLLLFFAFFEAVLIPMYFVIARWGGDGRGPAAQKFILVTVAGSAVMLLGLLVIGLQSGTFDMVALAAAEGAVLPRAVQVLAFGAIGLGFAIKTPAFPFHSWLPDAHTAAPTVGSVLLAGVMLKMGTYGFVRIGLPIVPEGAEFWAPVLGVLGVAGILYGSLACLAQNDLKRLIAFSSVGHMGFVLLGIATLTEVGVNGALFANIAHGVITGLLFFLVGGIKDRDGTTSFASLPRALYARAPRLGAIFLIAAVASLGLPGLAGFPGEFLAMVGSFSPAEGQDLVLFRTLTVLAAIGTVLTAAYLLQTVRRVNQGPVDDAPAVPDVRGLEAVAWLPLVALSIAFGVLPFLLLDLTTPAVAALLGGAV
jgi:NADH-quinone oxidoreductase subunit M